MESLYDYSDVYGLRISHGYSCSQYTTSTLFGRGKETIINK